MSTTHEEHVHESNGGYGFLLGVVLLIAFVMFLLYYGVPYFRSVSTPQINVPGTIDVNVNQK